MKKYFLNEKGLSLVEVLAAIVILAIVLIAFSSFFLQSAKHTKYNNEKLTAVQVAEEVVADVRKGLYQIDDDFDKGDYKVSIAVEPGPVPGLKKATIKVKSDPNVGIKSSEFETEMYFDGVTP